MMHVYPKSGGPWRDAVAGIRQRINLFDGERIVGIVRGDGLEDAADEVADIATETIVLGNDPSLREAMTFPSMIARLHGKAGRVFYCHTKGATHHTGSICQEWREVMLEACLDYPPLIDCMLSRVNVCGAFRRHEGLGVDYHYSGSFYWFNGPALWNRDWGNIHQVWYGVESWPAVQFGLGESGCLFLDYCGDLYSEDYWASAVRPALAAWRERMGKCCNTR